jgi:copper chaperone NosL
MKLNRRHLLLAACAAPLATLLAGCGKSEATAALLPVEIDPASTCDLDGMLLADYGGPKAQIHYVGQAAPVFCCDTVEMFNMLLRPEQVKAVRAAFVQDMGQADWDKPRGHRFDAKAGLYVVGSKRHGSMGPTFASFAAEPDAKKFAAEFGGKVLRFAEVKPDMADLSGGAQHDARM